MAIISEKLRFRPWYACQSHYVCSTTRERCTNVLNRYSVLVVAWTAFCHPGMFSALNVCDFLEPVWIMS